MDLLAKTYSSKLLDLYVWWMDVETGKTTRLTYHPAADVLPVFSPDGKQVLWTSSRNGPPQLFSADFVPPRD